MMRTASQPVLSPEGQVARVLGPGVRVAFVFPPWLSNTSRAPISPSLRRPGVVEPEGELEKASWNPRSVVPHSWVWILISATPGCFLDAPEPGLLCGEELTTSTQLGLWGQTPFRSNRPIRGRTASGVSKFSANSAGLPTSQAD